MIQFLFQIRHIMTMILLCLLLTILLLFFCSMVSFEDSIWRFYSKILFKDFFQRFHLKTSSDSSSTLFFSLGIDLEGSGGFAYLPYNTVHTVQTHRYIPITTLILTVMLLMLLLWYCSDNGTSIHWLLFSHWLKYCYGDSDATIHHTMMILLLFLHFSHRADVNTILLYSIDGGIVAITVATNVTDTDTVIASCSKQISFFILLLVSHPVYWIRTITTDFCHLIFDDDHISASWLMSHLLLVDF